MGNWQAYYLFNEKVQHIRFKEMCSSHEVCGRAICAECKMHGYKFLTCRQCRIWGYTGDPAQPDVPTEARRDYSTRAAAADRILFMPITRDLFTKWVITEFEKANMSIHNMFSFPEEWWQAQYCF